MGNKVGKAVIKVPGAKLKLYYRYENKQHITVGDIVVLVGDYYTILDGTHDSLLLSLLSNKLSEICLTRVQQQPISNVVLLYKYHNNSQNWSSYLQQVVPIIARTMAAPVDHMTIEQYIVKDSKVSQRYYQTSYLASNAPDMSVRVEARAVVMRMLDEVLVLLLQPHITADK